LLDAVRVLLGTTTKKDAVTTAMREVLAAQQRRDRLGDPLGGGPGVAVGLAAGARGV
jgi:Arc/MetJ family transcription regulator